MLIISIKLISFLSPSNRGEHKHTQTAIKIFYANHKLKRHRKAFKEFYFLRTFLRLISLICSFKKFMKHVLKINKMNFEFKKYVKNSSFLFHNLRDAESQQSTNEHNSARYCEGCCTILLQKIAGNISPD